MSGRFWNCVDCRIDYYYTLKALCKIQKPKFSLTYKGNGKVSCTSGSNSSQMRIKCKDWFLNDWQLPSQWSIHVQTTKVFTNLSQFGVNTA